MTWGRRFPVPPLSVVALALVFLTACQARDSNDSAETRRYKKPDGWATACVGRMLVDVPAPVDFGAGLATDYARPGARHYELPRGGPEGSGLMSIATMKFLETVPVEEVSTTKFDSELLKQRKQTLDYSLFKRRADAHFESERHSGGMYASEEERAATRARTTRQDWRDPRSFIWRSGNQLDFVTYLPADRRVRLMAGPLSGEGSAQQARAVVDAIWPRYRPRQPNEIPSDPGVCTPFGFFADPQGVTERDVLTDFAFRHPGHSNLLLDVAIKTRNKQTIGYHLQPANIEDKPTLWEAENEQSEKSRTSCKRPQGVGSRDVFGCTFAGVKTIKSHREVEYLVLADGRKARLTAVEYYHRLHGVLSHEVLVETLGTPDSAVAPYIVVSGYGFPKEAEDPHMHGKEPPSLDETIRIVRDVALSLRLRPGAIAEGAVVKDTLESVR